MLKKALLIITIPILIMTSLLVEPFSVSANTSMPAPFIGVNVTIIGVDVEYRYTSLASVTYTEDTNAVALFCDTMQTNGCRVYRPTTNYNPNNPTFTDFDVSVTIPQQSINYSSTYTYIYEYEFILDNYYVGYITLSFNNTSQTFYINGTSFKYSSVSNNFTFSITDYELNLLDNDKQYWIYPIESFTNILTLFNAGFEQVGINSYNNYLYPIFNEDNTKQISNTQVTVAQKKCILVMYTNRSIYNATTFNNFFTYNTNFTISDFKYVQRSTSGWIINVTFENTSSSTQNLNLRSVNSNGKFTVIYNNIYYNSYPVSTDFAIQFGLNNAILDNLEKIANGTTSSNNSSSSLNDANSEFDSTVSDYQQLETGFNDNLDNSMDDIVIEDVNNLGSTFLSSARWVSSQFNTLTNNTPFGSLLSFSMLIGLALLIIGKVYK